MDVILIYAVPVVPFIYLYRVYLTKWTLLFTFCHDASHTSNLSGSYSKHSKSTIAILVL